MYAIKLELKLSNKEKTLISVPDTPGLCIIISEYGQWDFMLDKVNKRGKEVNFSYSA